jgi:hypothetical protein
MANSFTVFSYSPKDVILLIGGYQITGWQRITINRVKGVAPVKGIRGKHTRVISRDTSATLSFSLMQSVQANEVMSYIHETDLQEGTGRISLTLKDNSGKSVFSSDEGYILSYPAVTFSGQFEDRPWELFLQTTKSYIVAGNQRPSTGLLDSALNEASNFVSDLL